MKTQFEKKFLNLAKLGENRWWRYVTAILIILAVWYFGIVTVTIFLITWVKIDNNPATNFNPDVTFQFEGLPSHILLPYVNSGFLFLLLGLYFTVRRIHRRRFLSLITAEKKINWIRIAQAFIISFSMQTLAVFLAYLVDPGSLQLNLEIDSFLLFLPVAFFIIPLQTSVEELFCRGYLMQSIGLIAQKAIVPILLSSILFTIIHLRNPEVLSQQTTISLISVILTYFISGFFLALVTIKDDSLELALGFHAAENIGVSLFISANNSVTPSPAIFSIGEIEGSLISIFALMTKYTIFYWLVFKVFSKPSMIDSRNEPIWLYSFWQYNDFYHILAVQRLDSNFMLDLAIQTENLTFHFPNGVCALEGLSIEVPQGNIFGFLGSNGSGKTTTIHLLLGLLKATSGEAKVLGFDTNTQSKEIRDRNWEDARKLDELKQQEEKGEIEIRYVDESGFCLIPYIPYVWQESKNKIEIKSQRSKRLNVLGFLSRQNEL